MALGAPVTLSTLGKLGVPDDIIGCLHAYPKESYDGNYRSYQLYAIKYSNCAGRQNETARATIKVDAPHTYTTYETKSSLLLKC